MLLQNPIQRGAIDAEWDTVKQYFPHSISSDRFAELFREDDGGSLGSAGDAALLESLQDY